MGEQNKEKTEMNNQSWDIEKEINLSLEVYKDISRQIQFADTKAGLILAWHGASLGFLSKLVVDNIGHLHPVGLKIATLVSILIGLMSAILSMFFAFSVVYPRLKDKSCQEECMFWIYHISCERNNHNLQPNEIFYKKLASPIREIYQSIKELLGFTENNPSNKGNDKFSEDINRFVKNVQNPQNVLNCIARSVVAVSEVLKRKYENLQLSMVFLLTALLFEVLTVFFLLVARAF